MRRATSAIVVLLIACGGSPSGLAPGPAAPDVTPEPEPVDVLSAEDEALLAAVGELLEAGAAPVTSEPLYIEWESLDDIAMGYVAIGDEQKARQIVHGLVDAWDAGGPLAPASMKDLFRVVIALGELETLERCESIALRNPETWRDLDLEALVGLYQELAAANPAGSEALVQKALDAIRTFLDLGDPLWNRKVAARLLVQLGEDGKARALAQESESLFEQIEDRCASDLFDMAAIHVAVGNDERAAELASQLEQQGDGNLALIVHLSMGRYAEALRIALLGEEGKCRSPYWVAELLVDLAQMAAGAPELSEQLSHRAMEVAGRCLDRTDRVHVYARLLEIGTAGDGVEEAASVNARWLETVGAFGHAAAMLIALGDADGAARNLASALHRAGLVEGDYEEPYIETADALVLALLFARTDGKGRQIARSMARGFIWKGGYEEAMQTYVALSDPGGVEDLILISELMEPLLVAQLHAAHWGMTGEEPSRGSALDLLDGLEAGGAQEQLLVAALYDALGEQEKSGAACAKVDPEALDEESLVRHAGCLSAHGQVDAAEQVARDLEARGKLESAFEIFAGAGNEAEAERLMDLLLTMDPARLAPLARFAVAMDVDEKQRAETFQALFEEVSGPPGWFAPDDYLETLVILRDAGFKKAGTYLKAFVKKDLEYKMPAQLAAAHVILGNEKKARTYLESWWSTVNDEMSERMIP